MKVPELPSQFRQQRPSVLLGKMEMGRLAAQDNGCFNPTESGGHLLAPGFRLGRNTDDGNLERIATS